MYGAEGCNSNKDWGLLTAFQSVQYGNYTHIVPM